MAVLESFQFKTWRNWSVAILLLGASISHAYAQSSVTLYGQVDQMIGAQKFPNAKRNFGSFDGGMSQSFFGLTGREDLGNGYAAHFVLESFFMANTGKDGRFPGDPFFSRNAYLGLESPYGTINAGRLTSSLFLSTITFNPFADSSIISPMMNHAFLGFGTKQAFNTDLGVVGDSLWNNAIQYVSPTYHGLNVGVMYGLSNQAGSLGSKKWSANINYQHGPLAFSGVYQYVNFSAQAGDLDSLVSEMKGQSTAQLAISYDFSFAKLFGQYMYTHNQLLNGQWHVNTGQAGVSIPVGNGDILGSYVLSLGSGGMNQNRYTWTAGYDYHLSKRTDAYLVYMNDRFSGLSLGQTYGVGIRHKF